MRNEIELGLNKSGLATAPRHAPQVLQVPGMTVKSPGDAKVLAHERVLFTKDAEPLATMPPPGAVKELVSGNIKLLEGQMPWVLVDEVAERLAYERGATRLYEGLISKHDALGSWEGGPTRQDLESIMRDELRHFHFLTEVMGMLGADSTAVTPSAEVHDLLATGLRMVVADPRADLRASLEALLQAELCENDCWLNLVRLALGYGENELAGRFQRCLEDERVHLSRVRTWLSAALAGEAFGDPRALPVHEPWVNGVAIPVRLATVRRVSTGNGGDGTKARSGRRTHPSRGVADRRQS